MKHRPKCDCGGPTILVNGSQIYAERPELSNKLFWKCYTCHAYVGCHEGTTKPLGRLAGKKLRIAKIAAHNALDPLWRAKMKRDAVSKSQARKAAYRWLADQLGIAFKDCHIGAFDEAMCEQVVKVCAPYKRGASWAE